MGIRVWVYAWELACCGDPFADGDVVTWTLFPHEDQDYLGTVLGQDTAASIGYFERHHDPASEDIAPATGAVAAIYSIHCRFMPDIRDPKLLAPLAGSGEVNRVHRADGWDSDHGDAQFLGYIVDLDDVEPLAT